jgi:hypothetical protein
MIEYKLYMHAWSLDGPLQIYWSRIKDGRHHRRFQSIIFSAATEHFESRLGQKVHVHNLAIHQKYIK